MSNTALLKSFVQYSTERINVQDVTSESFVTVDNMLPNKAGITKATVSVPAKGKIPSYQSENILIGNIRPYLKKIWFANKCGGCSPDVLVLKINSNHYAKFVYYALLQDDFFVHMMNGAKGTKMPRGDKCQILDFLIPNYPLTKQKKIATILSTLDAKIELNNRINTELEAMAKTLYDYWFVQFDFPDENDKPYKASGGKMVYNPVLKKEIPEGWDAVPLGAVASCIQRGISPVYTDKSSVTVLNQKCIRDHKIDFSKARLHDVHRKSVSAERFIQNGDILINSTGVGTLGRLTQVWGDPAEITIDSHITLIRPNISIISPPFLGYSLINREREIENLGEGSTGQTELSRNRLGTLEILNPHPAIQKKFSSIVESQLELTYKNIHENQELIQLRDWLLPMLMNGQVTVG